MLDKFPVYLLAGVMCLVPSFLLSVLISFGLRSFQAGLRIFLLFFGSIVMMLSLAYFMRSFPNPLFQGINVIVSGSALVVIFLMGIMGWINYKNGGKVYDTVKLRQQKAFGYLVGILFLWTFISEVVSSNGVGKLPETAFFLGLAACALFGKEFLSFQLREKGIVFRGRLSKFENIQSIQWEHRLRKEKVRITLHTGKTLMAKVPWELILPVDNHVRKYQSSS